MKLGFMIISFLFYSQLAFSNIQGLYKSVFYNETSHTAYYANVTLLTENPDGNGVRVSADVTFFFSEANSAESIRFHYDDVDYDIFTGEFTLDCESSPFKMTFVWDNDTLTGDWLLRKTGAFGSIKASTEAYPEIEEGYKNLSSLSGEYRGSFTRTNEQSRLPERISFYFLVTQDNTNPEQPEPKISGFAKFYIGNYGSNEYVKVKFSPLHYNFYDRTLALVGKIKQRTFTISATVSPTGEIEGVLSETALGKLGDLQLSKYSNDLQKVFAELTKESPISTPQINLIRMRF